LALRFQAAVGISVHQVDAFEQDEAVVYIERREQIIDAF